MSADRLFADLALKRRGVETASLRLAKVLEAAEQSCDLVLDSGSRRAFNDAFLSTANGQAELSRAATVALERGDELAQAARDLHACAICTDLRMRLHLCRCKGVDPPLFEATSSRDPAQFKKALSAVSVAGACINSSLKDMRSLDFIRQSSLSTTLSSTAMCISSLMICVADYKEVVGRVTATFESSKPPCPLADELTLCMKDCTCERRPTDIARGRKMSYRPGRSVDFGFTGRHVPLEIEQMARDHDARHSKISFDDDEVAEIDAADYRELESSRDHSNQQREQRARRHLDARRRAEPQWHVGAAASAAASAAPPIAEATATSDPNSNDGKWLSTTRRT